jgi:hypothetical protein
VSKISQFLTSRGAQLKPAQSSVYLAHFWFTGAIPGNMGILRGVFQPRIAGAQVCSGQVQCSI